MNDDDSPETNEEARELIVGSFLFFVVSTAVLVGLIVIMFSLGGFFSVIGWVLVAWLVLWDWRLLRQMVKLSRGDTSL